jgi:hypothetical protein
VPRPGSRTRRALDRYALSIQGVSFTPVVPVQSALLASNCWGFAYAVLEAASRPLHSLTLSLSSPQIAWTVFTSPRFQLLQSSVNDTRL